MSQQPMEDYPNPVMTTQQGSSSHSNGSFGPVFAVLAIIVVISAVACVLGRLCSKRHNRAKEGGQHHGTKKGGGKPAHQNSSLGPKEWESRQKPSFNMRDGDIEFGFDLKKPPSAKGAKNGGGKGKPFNENGAHRPEARFADNV